MSDRNYLNIFSKEWAWEVGPDGHFVEQTRGDADTPMGILKEQE